MTRATVWRIAAQLRLVVRLAGAAFACAVMLLCLAGEARAQLLDQLVTPDFSGAGEQQGVTVQSRARPDYDAPVVRLGSGIVAADATQSFGYDDNVTGFKPFRGSTVLQSEASLGVRSDWSRNALFGNISVNSQQYPDVPRESNTSWLGILGGTLELGRDRVNLTYVHDNLDATSRDLNLPDLDNPVAIKTDDVLVLYQAVFNRLTIQPGFDFTSYSFANGTVHGVPFNQSGRDRDVYAPSLTGRYSVAPLSDIVALVQVSLSHYNQELPNTPSQNYRDVTALAGYDTTIGEIWRLVLLGGYETRSFTSNQYKTITSPLARVRVTWSPTGLTTVTASLTRRITDTATDFTASTQVTQATLRVDHELRRNILLFAGADFEIDNYSQGGGSSTLYDASVGARWLLNRYVAVSGTYQLQVRNTGSAAASNGGLSPSYTDNRFLLQIRLRL